MKHIRNCPNIMMDCMRCKCVMPVGLAPSHLEECTGCPLMSADKIQLLSNRIDSRGGSYQTGLTPGLLCSCLYLDVSDIVQEHTQLWCGICTGIDNILQQKQCDGLVNNMCEIVAELLKSPTLEDGLLYCICGPTKDTSREDFCNNILTLGGPLRVMHCLDS